ncbi:MAG: cation-transporting P-type ATPase [Candidatus Palauibacterales bacterium]|nr:cation-transporting P-type ATPase [Candidatus Palauibacterales bacterium]
MSTPSATADAPSSGDRRAPEETPWTRPAEELSRELDVDPERGLSSEEAGRRLREHGANQLREHEERSAWEILVDQFRSLIVLLLGAAALLSFVFGGALEGGAIVAVLVINAAIGFATELRAVTSMEALRELGSTEARVLRDGQPRVIPARELVPGDVVLLEGGDVVTADLRLLEANRLEADESALTGESTPVEKQEEPAPGDAPISERRSMLYKGTAVTRGSGSGVVVATGMETELGHISELVEEAEEEVTPLEERLDVLGQRLVWVTVGLATLVAVSGVATGKDLLLIVETAIALAVAAIPEGLPIVATIALARGMWRMARRNALVDRLSAVETLGSTSVILTDKTGTLTRNRMGVERLALPAGDWTPSEEPDAEVEEAIRIGVLCNNAALPERDAGDDAEPAGDPTEVALLEAGRSLGMEREELLERWPEVREEAFDSETKMMATLHRRAEGDGLLVAVKGAPEAVLEASDRVRTEDGTTDLDEEERRRWERLNGELGDEGLRVLALATREADDRDASPYRELTFLGLVGLLDPAREDVRPSLEACRGAGVRVVMVTGDQGPTARYVARAVGLVGDEEAGVVDATDLGELSEADAGRRTSLLDTSIFARISPAQKLDLLSLHQEAGNVTAMIGDGVNDAPALKKADIGVAMGKRGTQVAREAADMVLQDDRFGTIVTAIEHGRAIFDNIRKFVVYLLSCNVSELMVVTLATLAGAPLPLLPLQILFLNLVTDVFPALALGVGEGAEGILERPPREKEEPILESRHWWSLGAYGAVITGSVLTAFWLALGPGGMGETRAVTVSFLTLALAQLWHVLNMTEAESGVFRNEVTGNPWIWGALVLCVGLILGATYLPGISGVMGLEHPGAAGWRIVVAFSLLPLAAGRLYSAVRPYLPDALRLAPGS